MLWAIGGMALGLLLGAGAIWLFIAHKFGKAMGEAFGLPYKPWWKFWK